MSAKTKTHSGVVTANYRRLKGELLLRGLSETQFCLDFGLIQKTVTKVRLGEPIRPSSLASIAKALDLSPLDLVNDSSEWDHVEALGKWQKVSSGIVFCIWRLKHNHLADTWGRGKCYRMQNLATRDQEQLREAFLRHSAVCRRFRGEPHIPINLSVYPEMDGKTWWSIDEWVDGHSLAQVLETGPLLTDDLPRVMRQIALGLRTLHQAVVVRRNLSPENILIRKSDRAVFLTDFEMSKFFDNSPTVAGDWPLDPYRAPEVGHGDPDVRVDLYSWARIFVHAATGQLPEPPGDTALLDDISLPAPVRDVLRQCLSPQQHRPRNIDAVLCSLQDWQ